MADQLNDLAVVLLAQRHLEAAESAYAASGAIRLKVLGPDNLRTILSRGGLANVRSQRGDLATSIPMQREVVASLDRLFPDDRARRATQRFNLAGMLLRADSAGAALTVALEALRLRQDLLGSTHRLTLEAMDLAGRAATEAGDVARAESLLTAAGKQLRNQAGSRDLLAEVLRHLGALYARTGHRGQARSVRQEVVALDSANASIDPVLMVHDQAALDSVR